MAETESKGGIGGPPPSAQPVSWPVLRLFPGLLVIIVFLILVQHGVEGEWRGGLLAGMAILAVAGLIGLWRARKTIHNTICSVPFAVAMLITIAAATALGTFVPQGVKEDFLTQHYGAFGMRMVQGLFLADVFHSCWYGGLLTLMVLSLLTLVLRRPFWRPVYWGFALGHGGMVITIVGGVIGSFYGMHGMMALHKGSRTDVVFTGENGDPNRPRVQLKFALRLDDFEVERYRDEPRFEVIELKEREEETVTLATFKPELIKDWTALPKSNASFRVREFTPAGSGTKSPRHLVQIEGSPAFEVQVGQTYKAPGTERSFKVVEFIPDFYFDMEMKRGASRGDEPNNPALLIEEPGASAAALPRRQWLFAHNPGHGQKEGDLPLRYTYSDSRFASVAIEIKEKGETNQVTLTADESPGSGCRLDHIVLAFRVREGEPKAYRSKVSVLEGGAVVREATVAVNAPLRYGGYEFYQSDWRKEDLNYSGLKVVRDPGLNLVYLGMVCLSLGMLFVYYLRPRLGQRG